MMELMYTMKELHLFLLNFRIFQVMRPGIRLLKLLVAIHCIHK